MPTWKWRYWIDGGWIDRPRAVAGFERMHRRDAIGDRINLCVVLVGVAAALGPTTVSEIALAPMLGFFFWRVLNTGPTWKAGFGQPAAMAALGIVVWQLASLLWTSDVGEGVDEFGQVRWLWVGVMMWPVIERRRWIIAALAVGFLAGNVGQLGHFLGVRLDIGWMTQNRAVDRNSGWWEPVVGGSLLTAAVGLHLPAALMGAGRTRVLGLAGASISIIGVLATGTRGAWIATAGLIGLVVVVALLRRVRSGGVSMRWAAGAAASAAVVGLVGWIAVGDSVASRFERATDEINAAWAQGDYRTDTGKRLMMMRWAVDAAIEHPVRGLGVGGYRDWMQGKLLEAGVEPDELDQHGHAHSTFLHAAAVGGVLGLGLLVFMIAAGIRGGLRGLGVSGLGSYDAGPAFALIGLVLAGAFDSIQVNAQTAMMLGLLIGLCPAWRPGGEYAEDAEDAEAGTVAETSSRACA